MASRQVRASTGATVLYGRDNWIVTCKEVASVKN